MDSNESKSEVTIMVFENNIQFTAKDILEKDFKSKLRGYDPDEVDKFLDLVIKDYETLYKEIDRLTSELNRTKRDSDSEPRRQQTSTGITNYDILKRLSNLEKHVFGNKLSD
jgi:DivIVA domain-containing protein